MIKKVLLTAFVYSILTANVFSAGSSDSGEKTKSSYDTAVTLIKAAKKFEEEGKSKKANKKYEKAQKLLMKSNKKKPNDADTLNYLGFTTRKLGDYENGEKFYLEGLAIEPNHIGINEYLGELYVVTNRISLAKERLKILENCDCKEYIQLKEIINGVRKSKY